MLSAEDLTATQRTLWFAIGATILVVLLDLAFGPALVLTPLLVVGPLIAATAGPVVYPLALGSVATAIAVLLGWANEVPGQMRHVVSVITVVAGSAIALYLARVRLRREAQLAHSQPHLDLASRLVRVMHAGSIGEWRWTQRTNELVYDDEAARLFGVQRRTKGPLTGDAAQWLAAVDDRDREAAMQTIGQAIDRGISFRFDHRCVWPDGSIHWVEVLGEPTRDDEGSFLGAAGLVSNVDERHRQLDERARLLDLEHRARQRAEYLARVHDVLARSVDVDEILQRITEAAVPELADWCSAVFVADRPRTDPLIVAAHRDAHMRRWAGEILQRFPYNPDSHFGSAKVIRTGEREVLEHVARSIPALRDEQRDVLETGDIDSVATFPLVGQLGILGSLQFIRGRGRAAFSAADLELAEELANRCGMALNTAVLFARQATSSAALETLQQVSGWLARAMTRHDVAEATITHGAVGLGANGAAIFEVDHGGDLVPMLSHGLSHPDRDGWLRRVADAAIKDERLVVDAGQGAATTVLAAPLRILDRITGAVVFTFTTARVFSTDELAMVTTLLSRCAGALERASLYERERDVALMLQRRLLPQVPPVPGWLEVGSRYEPAPGGQVGGDWFQLIRLDDDRVVAAVGDAVGHGLTSAAAMGQLRSSIATAVSVDPDPAEVLSVVDRFASSGIETLAATAAVALLDGAGSATVGVAGHLPPILVRGTSAELLEFGRRPLLGFGAGGDDDGGCSFVAPFTSGDLLVMYTDGLVERRGEHIDIGLARLRKLCVVLRDRPAQEICDALVEHLAAGTETDDDIAVLVLRRTAGCQT